MSDRCLIGSTESQLGETPRNVPGCLWQRVSPWRPAHALRSSDDIPPSRGVEIFCLVELLHRRGEVLTHLSVWRNYKLGILLISNAAPRTQLAQPESIRGDRRIRGRAPKKIPVFRRFIEQAQSAVWHRKLRRKLITLAFFGRYTSQFSLSPQPPREKINENRLSPLPLRDYVDHNHSASDALRPSGAHRP